ncbi:MAG: peptide chain release factor N(5)-glutamine methyltransferase [Sphingobacteriaceae bacterium]|nr:peptide chain release factor N(5)-glutamine methyltransferase [Sphingobacteriaceae bacterium]
MKIATNKLSDLYEFYKNELSLIYDEGELYSIFELVCEKYLNYSKAQVKQHFDENINQSNLINIYNTGVELKKGAPIQYILKEAYFYDLTFNVSNAVLIPRPETEELVDLIIKSQTTHNSPISILDIGTGSGCIPITLKKHLPLAKVFGIDISEQALEVAKSNALKNNVDVEFIKQNILSNFLILNSNFSIIVSNPPYVLNSEAKQMDVRVLEHEPHLALFVEDNDPIIFYKRIIDLCDKYLEEKGWLYFELNPMYAIDVKNYANDSKIFNFTEILNDMSGKQRFLKAQKK